MSHRTQTASSSLFDPSIHPPSFVDFHTFSVTFVLEMTSEKIDAEGVKCCAKSKLYTLVTKENNLKKVRVRPG